LIVTDRPAFIFEISQALEVKYKNFSHYNRRNPFEELLYILCTVRTSEKNYQKIYKNMKVHFPRREMLANTSVEELADIIHVGGLQRRRANNILRCVAIINETFGKLSLSPLKKLNDIECERFLKTLPGVGTKVARCVMLYSLDRMVFPVDTHCWRICKRIGWITTTNQTCTEKDMDRIQDMIPKDLRFKLHVNMISLGRDICTAKKPNCGYCPISRFCQRIGVD